MDNPKEFTHVSLCAGYGGIDIGLKRAIPNMRTVAFSEIEAYACANLVSKMEKGLLDAAPIWSNLKTFPWADFHNKVGILSGGYPCQPFSSAGKRLGQNDPRHLWPYIANGIRLMHPSVCFFENVEGHISLGLREVLTELEEMGYRTTWGIFSASEVGAPHQRKRIFILAYAYDQRHYWSGLQYAIKEREVHKSAQQKSEQSMVRSEAERCGAIISNSYGERLEGHGNMPCGVETRHDTPCRDSWWETEPNVGRVADGSPNRVDRLRLLGNGVVPQTAELAFRTLLQRL